MVQITIKIDVWNSPVKKYEILFQDIIKPYKRLKYKRGNCTVL